MQRLTVQRDQPLNRSPHALPLHKHVKQFARRIQVIHDDHAAQHTAKQGTKTLLTLHQTPRRPFDLLFQHRCPWQKMLQCGNIPLMPRIFLLKCSLHPDQHGFSRFGLL